MPWELAVVESSSSVDLTISLPVGDKRSATVGRKEADVVLENDKSLSRKHAELKLAQGLDGSLELFVNEGLEALAGLRPRLITDVERLPGARILDGQFTAVQQAIGTKPDRTASQAWLRDFVEDAKASGVVQGFIDQFGVTGRLTVAPPATGWEATIRVLLCGASDGRHLRRSGAQAGAATSHG